MASFSSESNQTHPKAANQITQEELYAFHNVDRQFFIRLVFSLRRDLYQAMQVVAFWLWLERFNMAQYVATIIRYPDPIFEALFEETLLCLKVADESKEMVMNSNTDVPMVKTILGVHREGINLRFFKDNSVKILLEVGSIVRQTCLRAFEDLLQTNITNEHMPPRPNVHYSPNVGVVGDGRGSQISRLRPTLIPNPQLLLSSIYEHNLGDDDRGVLVYNSHLRVGDLNLPVKGQNHTMSNASFLQGDGAGSSNNFYMSLVNAIDNDFAIEPQPHQILRGDLVDQLLAQMNKIEERKVPQSERTIFLTFSKGYPIHEIELREFLNRSFGDIIETLTMQEVGANEQPLYARLVVRDAIAMVAVLSEHGKSKFAINGKHVWARKFVHKANHNSPPISPSTN